MKSIILFWLIFLFGLGGCAYYPVKNEIKLLNKRIINKEKDIVYVMVNKKNEVEVSEVKISLIQSLIVQELKTFGFKKAEKNEDALLKINIFITDYEEGSLTLRLLGGSLHGAGKSLIKATILVTQNRTVLLEEEIEVKMNNNLFNLYSIYGTETGVQKTFSKEVVKTLEKVLK